MPESRVVVWEALDVLGGRFHTERTANGGACDTGAQYVTVTDDEAVASLNAPVLEELSSAGILTAMHGRILGGRAADGKGANYVAPAGLSSVVTHMFASSRLLPVCARRAVRLCAATTPSSGESARGGGQQWEVYAADGHVESFDAVVLTQPLPDMLALLDTGDTAGWLPQQRNALQGGKATATPSMDVALSRADLESVLRSSRTHNLHHPRPWPSPSPSPSPFPVLPDCRCNTLHGMR